MQYLIDQAVFTANSVLVVQGSNSLYTYQNIGNASGTIQGSNDNSTWATVVTIASGNTAVIEHSYKYLKLVGNTQILVNRGEGNNTPDGGTGSADYPPFTGNANKVLAVKSDETGVEWTTVSSGGVALGETSSTAYRGDNGKIAYDHSLSQGNPHNTTTSEINEGTKLFFTESRVNQTVLTGLNTSTASPALATDQLLTAIGKLQAQINNIAPPTWVSAASIGSVMNAFLGMEFAKINGNLWVRGRYQSAASISTNTILFVLADAGYRIEAPEAPSSDLIIGSVQANTSFTSPQYMDVVAAVNPDRYYFRLRARATFSAVASPNYAVIQPTPIGKLLTP